MSSLLSLFPFLTLILTASFGLYFIWWKYFNPKGDVKPEGDDKPTNIPAKNPVRGAPPSQPEYAPPTDVEEGFQTQASVPTYPVWTQPSIIFLPKSQDKFYDEYEEVNLKPNPEVVKLVGSLPPDEKTVPNYGAELGTFDSGTLTDIPWDADNKDYIQEDIVWGTISRSASASIFQKVYHNNLAADSGNLIEADSNFQYHSPVLGVNAYDETTSSLLQSADAVAGVLGQELLDNISDIFNSQAKKANIKAIDKALQKGVSDPAMRAKLTANKDELARSLRAEERATKIKLGQELNAVEKAQQAASDAKSASKLKWFNKITKQLKKVTSALKRMLGINAAKRFATRIAARIGALFTKLLIKVLEKVGLFLFMTLLINQMGIASCTAAVATLGGLSFLCAISSAMAMAWNILSIICMIVMIACMIILPSLLDKALENGGVCPRGKPLDQIITDEFLYFTFTTFIPIGGVLDAFGPYLCYADDGSVHMKQPLYIPPYYSDSTLSLYKHMYSAAQTARAESTRYTDPKDSLPPGWTITAGIARAPCDPGTWTSSDVDMLCNISTYVPETYTKQSSVPVTTVKASRVPTTYAKHTYITTTAKSSTPATKIGCNTFGFPNARDDDTSCWEDHKCNSVCRGGWDPTHWSCHTECGGCACIRKRVWERSYCPSGMNNVLGVCWTDCTGKVDWGAFCTATSCSPGYDYVAGVCWRNCGGDIDVGALCRQRCNQADGEYEVLGVCWKGCPENTIDVGALCRARCGGSTGNEVAGVCWGSCGNDIDVGALCRKRCREGFHEVAGVCWGNTGTYARQSAIPKATKIYDPGYNPPVNLSGIDFPYCDFSSQTMLDRMGQFYYDQSSLHAQTVPDGSGRVSFEYIVMFYGVIASSELSCDVACRMKTITFDPITGDKYEQKFGTSYSDDPGNSVSYRRFYFIKQTSDPQGVFTVTACTNSDYTAPDAQSKSTDGGDPIISLPKVYNVRDKRVAMGTWDNNTFKQSLAVTTVNMGLGAAFGGGLGGQVIGAVAGTMAGEAVAKRMSQASGAAASIGAAAENSVVKDDAGNYYVSTNNDNFSINFGPIYEIRARDGQGVIPSINFCGKIITTPLLCSNKFILRDTIDLYHTQNPTKRVKRVDIIEPRGRDGCYYLWNTVDYNPNTNTEGSVSTQMEIVRRYQIVDRSTCVFTPTTTFVTDMTNYPVRSYPDLEYGKTRYPTREIKSVATYQGRYIRVRPSQTASDSFMQITQIAVFDSTGNNLALNRPVYATSSYIGSDGPSAPPNTVVNGTFSALSGNTNTWQNGVGNSAQNDYLEIDLGKNYLISHIVYFGRLDNPNTTRNMGIRFQILFTNGPEDTVVKELLTTATNLSQVVDFCTETLVPKQPVKPFEVPQPLPPEVNLGSSCPARCQDKTQIDEFVKQYNANPVNSSAQIIKIIRAVTPKVDRCDFEAQIIRTTGGKKFSSKEFISASISEAGTTANTGTIYGRYVRVKPPATSDDGFLNISQIAVMDPAGTNIARGRKAYASSLLDGSSPASIAVDGTLATRAWPNIWHSNTATMATEFWEVDLGISQPISSIVYYGRDTSSNGATPDRNTGVIVEVYTSRDSNTVPVYSGTLTSNASPQTLRFTQCRFTFTPIAPTGSFIQGNTPLLNAIDTSGGVLTFQSIVKGVADVFNSVVNPIKNSKPLDVLNTNVNSSDTTAKNVLNAAAANIELQGCPTTKCSDPAVLAAIVNSYNASNSATSSGQFGAETNTMAAISKSGISGPNTCDVMFTNLYSLYDDVLYPAVNTENSTMVKRFTLTNGGNCAMNVAPTSVDISMNAFGISPASATLNAPYTTPACQVNCRDAAIMSSVRQRLNTQSQTTTSFPDFNTVVQSFASGPTTCEYYMQKDVSTKNLITNRMTSDAGLDTYVRANFNVNLPTCAFTLNTVNEFDPDAITTSTDPVSGTLNSYIKGALVNPPYLMNYDNTVPSIRVNETVQKLS